MSSLLKIKISYLRRYLDLEAELEVGAGLLGEFLDAELSSSDEAYGVSELVSKRYTELTLAVELDLELLSISGVPLKAYFKSHIVGFYVVLKDATEVELVMLLES